MDTISLKEKKLFEVFLNALVAENVSGEYEYSEVYELYDEKLQKKLGELQLDDLLSNAAEHLAKQNRHHKWMKGTSEEQLENFNREGFEILLKVNPSIKKMWDQKHTKEAEMLLPGTDIALEAALKVIDGTETEAELDMLAEEVLSWDRKPRNLGDIQDTILRSKTTDFSTFTDYDLYERDVDLVFSLLQVFINPPTDTTFILETDEYGDYLVDTQGYNYARYFKKIVD